MGVTPEVGKTGIVGIINENGPRLKTRACSTCADSGWILAIQESLEAMLEGDLHLQTPIAAIYRALTKNYVAMQIPRYKVSESGLRKHITRCEETLWNEIRIRRGQIARNTIEEDPEGGA